MSELEKDNALRVLADYIVNNNINYVGGEFEREDTKESFMVTVSKESALKNLTDDNDDIKAVLKGMLISSDTLTETIAQQAERIAELSEALSKSNKQLADSGNELASYITDKNEELKKGICSTDLDDPDWHDHQTVCESMKLIESNDKLLAKGNE